MTPLEVFAIVRAGAETAKSVFEAIGAFRDAFGDRGSRDLRAIRSRLAEMDRKLDMVLLANAELLRKLDELPELIRVIVRGEVRQELLDKAYAELEGVQQTFLALPEGTRFSMTSSGWMEIVTRLSYLFDKDSRISQLPTLLRWCEFALIVSQGGANPVVAHFVARRAEQLNVAKLDLDQRALVALSVVHAAVNSPYLTSNNIETVRSIDELAASYAPDRFNTTVTSHRECIDENTGGDRPGRPRCTTITTETTEIDKGFSDARNALRASVDVAIREAKTAVPASFQVAEASRLAREYLASIANAGNPSRIGEIATLILPDSPDSVAFVALPE